MKKFVRILIVLTILLATALAWNLRKQRQEETRAPGSSGIVEGTRVLISSRIASRILEIPITEGQRVKAGDLLAVLDCTDADAAVASAEARTESMKFQIVSARRQKSSLQVQGKRSKRDSERAVALQKERVMDDATVESLQASSDDISERVSAAQASVSSTERQYEAAKAELKRAQWLQKECRVSTPLSGIITVKAKEPGEVVLAGSTLFEIRDESNLKVKFYITNRDLGRVKIGMSVNAVADAFPTEKFDGLVTRISEEAEFTPKTVQTRSDRDRLVYAIDASLTNKNGMLKAGMPVDVSILESARP
jgi:HlyD family secretion protein